MLDAPKQVKPTSRSSSEKADATTRAALEIIRQETAARDAKTARLKALRLAMEAEQAVDAEKAAPPKPKTARAPRVRKALSGA